MFGINGRYIDDRRFPDGTRILNQINNIRTDGINHIFWRYEDESELFGVYSIAQHVRDHGGRAELFMPYIPNARQDRVRRLGDVFTLKYFADIINACNFTRVHVYDPHSPVSEALINNIHIVDVSPNIVSLINRIICSDPSRDVVIYYPDNGAYKKYSDNLPYPSCYGAKKRDWETGKITGLDVITNGEDLKNKTILMVDDIISYGGSMFYGIKALKGMRCGDVYIYATHVENSILEGSLINCGLFKGIYTTDSIFTKTHELIHVEEVLFE